MSTKYYLVTPVGEKGPFQYGELSIMFQKGQMTLSDLCREDGATEAKRLDELFPKWVQQAAASKNFEVESANRLIREGKREISVGVVMIAVPTVMLLFFNVIGSLQIVLFLVGIGAVSRGVAQKRRGTLALAKLGWDRN